MATHYHKTLCAEARGLNFALSEFLVRVRRERLLHGVAGLPGKVDALDPMIHRCINTMQDAVLAHVKRDIFADLQHAIVCEPPDSFRRVQFDDLKNQLVELHGEVQAELALLAVDWESIAQSHESDASDDSDDLHRFDLLNALEQQAVPDSPEASDGCKLVLWETES